MRPLRTAKPVRGRPATGLAKPAAVRMREYRARRRAAGLRPQVRWVRTEPPSVPSPASDHRFHDIVSLALHAAVVRKIGRDSALLSKARGNLRRWRSRFTADTPRWWKEWDDILECPWSQIAALLLDPSENATRLRQSSPFAGVLTPQERKRIYDALRA